MTIVIFMTFWRQERNDDATSALHAQTCLNSFLFTFYQVVSPDQRVAQVSHHMNGMYLVLCVPMKEKRQEPVTSLLQIWEDVKEE